MRVMLGGCFCEMNFYADHGITVVDEWDRVHPKDKGLRQYVQRRRLEQMQQNIDRETEDMISQLSNLRVFGEGIMVGGREHRMFVLQRIIDNVRSMQSVVAYN